MLRRNATLQPADSSLTDYVAGFIVDTQRARHPEGRRAPGQALGARRHRPRARGRGVADAAHIARQISRAARHRLRQRQHGDRQRRCACRRASPRSPTGSRSTPTTTTTRSSRSPRIASTACSRTRPRRRCRRRSRSPSAIGAAARDLMLAYQVGVEVECKVAEAILPRHYQHGFHSTATCGSIGAAAGAAKLLGLDRETTRRALSIGATQAAGCARTSAR